MADNEFYRVDVVIDVQGEEDTKRSLNRTQKVIEQTEKKTRMLDKAKASPVVRVIDRVTKPLNDINKKISEFAKKAAKKVAIFTTAAAIAVSGFAVASTKEFIKFEQGMNEVFTLMPGITQSAMDDMSKEVRQFSKDFGVLPEKVVPALYQSISAGVPPDNVFDFLATAQKAAVGGVTELETAVDGISSVVNAYGADVVSAAQASDLMFTAVKLGKTNFEQLAGSLYNVIPTASALGVQFGDVTAAMAAMTAQGTPTSVATTQMRQLLVELSKDGGKASKMFKDMAGKTFKQFIAEGNNVQDALQLMEKAAGKSGVGINDLFSSVEAGNAALSLTGKGTEAFGNALKEMVSAAGATDAAYAQMEKGLGRSLEKIKASFKVLMIDVGEKFAPIVYELAEAFQDKMPAIQAAVERATDRIITAFKTVITIGKGMAKVFSGDSAEGQSILETIMPASQAAKVVAVIQSLSNAFDGMMRVIDFVKRNFDIIGPAIAAVVGTYIILSFYAWATAAWSAAVATISATWPLLAVLAAVGLAVAGLMWVWKNNFGGIQEKTRAVIDFIMPYIDTAITVITGIIKTFLKLITGDFSGALEAIKDTFIKTIENIKKIIANWVDTGVKIGSTFIQNIIDGFLGMWSDLKQKANEMWDSITGIFSKKSKVSVDVEAKAGTSRVMGIHARGGILTKPHLGLVAEEGPEAIIPLRSGKKERAARLWEETGRRLGFVPYADGAVIAPPSFTAPRMAFAGAGGNMVNIDIDAQVEVSLGEDGIDEEALALKIGMKIVREIKNALVNKG